MKVLVIVGFAVFASGAQVKDPSTLVAEFEDHASPLEPADVAAIMTLHQLKAEWESLVAEAEAQGHIVDIPDMTIHSDLVEKISFYKWYIADLRKVIRDDYIAPELLPLATAAEVAAEQTALNSVVLTLQTAGLHRYPVYWHKPGLNQVQLGRLLERLRSRHSDLQEEQARVNDPAVQAKKKELDALLDCAEEQGHLINRAVNFLTVPELDARIETVNRVVRENFVSPEILATASYEQVAARRAEVDAEVDAAVEAGVVYILDVPRVSREYSPAQLWRILQRIEQTSRDVKNMLDHVRETTFL